MKLLREVVDYKSIEILKEEAKEPGEPSIFRLKGPMIGANIKNRNGRTYPTSIVEREVQKFNEQRIDKGMNRGELGHPNSPEINLDRVSHIIEKLYMDGDTALGIAKIIDTPMGRIAQTLVKEKQSLGMSTRGVGSVSDDGTVKEDFLLCTIDLVDSPSFDKAVMEAVLENKEWIIQGDKFVEVAVHNLQKSVEKKYDPKSMSNHVLTYMMKFLDEIQQKKV